MGYTSCKLFGQTPTQFLKKEYKDAKYVSVVGRQAFVVWESFVRGITTVEVVTFSVRGGEIIWKSMPETWHPYYYNCPAKVLRMLSPTTNEYALTWRAKCWETVERNKK